MARKSKDRKFLLASRFSCCYLPAGKIQNPSLNLDPVFTKSSKLNLDLLLDAASETAATNTDVWRESSACLPGSLPPKFSLPYASCSAAAPSKFCENSHHIRLRCALHVSVSLGSVIQTGALPDSKKKKKEVVQKMLH